MIIKNINVVAILIALAFISTIWFFYTSTFLPDGEVIFKREGCFGCHSFKGQGGSLGPDLTAITNKRSKRWIERYIKNPMSINPDSRMPQFKNLSKREIKALIRYLNSTK